MVDRLGSGSTALGRVGLGEVVVLLLFLGAVKRLLKDGLLLVDLELGLEVGDMMGEAAAVGAAAGVCELKIVVSNIIAEATPVLVVRK